ncbi:MAG TPA: D-alanyl-D-alanine carboxypeptidase family protein, partial [Terracidiphilus sp.]|nr:D-alanyl-D-alanine carboxypeptidase family protein [Terracidiphilus sp.]
MMLFKAGWQALAASKLSAQIKYSTVLITMGGLAAFVCVPRPAHAVVHASIVVDAETGVVLHAQNADHLAHPASLAKLMTLYITFERLDSGRLTLGQKLHISRHAASRQPARLGLRPGASISVRSAILAIVTKSANDAAVVLAEGITGSESRFARLMTRTARELGMQRTTFYNASGLPNRRQWTTARDMSTLALAIINDFPAYYHFFRVRSFRFHGRTIYGHDHLLGRYPGADGLKTGFIRASGYNLVTSAVRHQRRLVGVVLGGSTAASRDR